MDERLQNIRKRLRLAMNGTISASMREKGNVYKLNFGVPIPELRLIAKEYEPNAELAEMMWQEDTRELKILATLLYPHDSMEESTVTRWITEIPYPEISEQMAFNLLRYLPNPGMVPDSPNEGNLHQANRPAHVGTLVPQGRDDHD